MLPDPASVSSLPNLVTKLGSRILYPGLPFYIIPALVAGLIASQFSGNLTHYPGDIPAAMDLPLTLTNPTIESRQGASLILVPNDSSDFFLSSEGEGIKSVWLSMSPETISANRGRLSLSPEGLDVGRLRGVDYPLVVVIEGTHAKSVEPESKRRRPLAVLEFATAEFNWITLFLLGGAVFGFGASTGFMNDGVEVQGKHPGANKGHDESKD